MLKKLLILSSATALIVGCDEAIAPADPVVNKSPVASATVSTNLSNPISVNEAISFDSAASIDSDGVIVDLVWYVDNQAQSESGATFTTSFATSGTHTVKLLVIDDKGAINEVTFEVVVQEVVVTQNQAPTAVITGPTSALLGSNTTFSASGSSDRDGSIAAYNWTVNGVSAGTGFSMTASNLNLGNNSITLFVTDNKGQSSAIATHYINVTSAVSGNTDPTVSIASDLSIARVGDSKTYTAMANDSDGTIASYQWFVNGVDQSESSNALSVTFANTAAYVITVIVTDNDGATADSMVTESAIAITENNTAPIASFTKSATSIEQNQSITFTSNSDDSDGTITSYRWSIDGETVSGATGAIFTHQFNSTGSFDVSLVVTDNDGDSNLVPASQTVTVTTSTQNGFEDFSLITTQDGMRVYEITNCGDMPAAIPNSSQSFSSFGQFWGHINSSSANQARWSNLAKGYQVYENAVVANDANCNDVSVYNTTLVKRYSDWDNQHANGYHVSANQFNYSDVDYIVFELYFDATESTLPSVAEIQNNFPNAVSLSGGQISSIEDWDEGKFQLNLQLNSGDGSGGTNYNLAEINIQLQPEWANKWLRLEIPIDEMHHFDSVSYAKNTKTASSNTNFNRISFVAETKNYAVYRNWTPNNQTSAPSEAEMFKEINYSVKRLELIGK